MMKFYCVVNSDGVTRNKRILGYLREACEARNLEFIILEVDTFDYSQDLSKVIETPGLLYRVACNRPALIMESLLMRQGLTTLYKDDSIWFERGFPWRDTIIMEKLGLPVIPTVFNVRKEQDAFLAKYVESLGGFPVILKASGGSHGASVLRLDSIGSLRSVLGFVTADNARGSFVMRKFIHNAVHLRMVVIGDRVVDAIRYLPQPDDFRTNAVAVPEVEAYKPTAENQHYFDLAAEAVKALGLEFGGVDLLIDEKGDAYIAEVNFPCNFARNQMNTGFDVAGTIVDHLLAKAQQ